MINKAKILHSAGFFMYGAGNFDLTETDINTILAVLDAGENVEKQIQTFYKELYDKRMG